MRRTLTLIGVALYAALIVLLVFANADAQTRPFRRIGRTMRTGEGARPAASGFATNTYSLLLESANSEYAELTDSAAIEPGAAFTVVVNVRQTAATNNQGIISKWQHGTATAYAFQTTSCTATACQLQLFIASSNPSTGAANCTTTGVGDMITEGVWYTLTWWYDGSEVTAANRSEVYVNNTLATKTCSGTLPASVFDTSAPLRIGNWAGTLGTRYWGGNIDELYMWHEALDSTERSCAYTAVAAGTDASACADTSPVLIVRGGDSGDTLPTLLNDGSAGNFTVVNGGGNEIAAQVP